MSRNIALKGPQQAPVILYNRTTAKATAFAETLNAQTAHAAIAEPSLPKLVQDASITFICVGDDSALDQIIHSITADQDADLTSKIIIDCSTVHPDTSRRTHAALAARGASFIACPVFGAPNMADAGQMIVVPAGAAEAVARVQPFFEGVTARKTLDLGERGARDVGLATTLKLIGNSFILNTVETVAESLVVADKSGLGADKFQEFMHAFLPGPFAKYADRMCSGDYYQREEPLFAVDLARKDVRLAGEIAERAGVTPRSLQVTDGYLQQVKAEKGVKGDIAGVYGAIRKESGLPYDN
ncbi:hypothetical protein P175DRAFT_0502959 [Aspergillus ochraceoroseus IBT 24754]|uniref:6-phosphogluconate dehydrogenase NADP-binding domain-containing protein n=1 Tax=Aspergillus ochraceoroseus IBT 24754 TaxID=1392256 RepID=A0A2T5LT14_9EURO|nr:uncharacterized protein P175DRAFT_0502959 [Aspergillus ochraceoroseus IBT 24754]PTU19419.1 hypothetical protein P175DRAFT_0502959 [Aspergillus ochraceoroseus IBT 24754]